MAKDEQAIGFEDGRGSGPESVEGGAPANKGSKGPNEARVQPHAAKDAEKRLNPSAPGETGTTPGTNQK